MRSLTLVVALAALATAHPTNPGRPTGDPEDWTTNSAPVDASVDIQRRDPTNRMHYELNNPSSDTSVSVGNTRRDPTNRMHYELNTPGSDTSVSPGNTRRDLCWQEDSALLCGTITDKRDLEEKLTKRTFISQCTVDGVQIPCWSVHKRSELVERSAGAMCTLDGSAVACHTKRGAAVEVEQRDAGATGMCKMYKDGKPICPTAEKLKERDAEAEPVPVPLCIVNVDRGCDFEPTGNAKFHSMSGGKDTVV